MNKKIGIVGYAIDTMFGVQKSYLNYFSQFGEIKILMPDCNEVEDINMLVLPGGMDMNPTSYGENPSYMAGHVDVFKQRFYDVMLQKYFDKDIPVLGICLGMQQLAVTAGAKLTQHITGHQLSDTHTITVEQQVVSELFGARPPYFIDSKGKMKVNSRHHQCVRVDSATEDMKLIAWSDDGVVEAFSIGENIIGVQWHPEDINCPLTTELIKTKLLWD